MSVKFINPVADCLIPIKPYTLCLDLSRPVVIGLVVNKIVGCDLLMHEIGETLMSLNPDIRIKTFETGTITYAASELIDEIATHCNAAICAIGHCGSCTAGTVKDGIALIERGIPAVSLITSIFWEQATALSRSLGWPGAPRIQLPYPIWGTGTAYMNSVANQIIYEIIQALEANREASA
ncbi:MAG: hypothetical protein ACI8P9_000962 [Parasphingorhabdus sp.]